MILDRGLGSLENATGRDRSGVALVGEGERERVRPRETMVERREG